MAMRRKVRRRVRRSRPTVRRAPSSSAAGIRTEAKQSMGSDSGLMIGGVHDPAERQADRMADRVMRMPSPGPVVHRKCEGCEGEEKKVKRMAAAPAEEEKEVKRMAEAPAEEEKVERVAEEPAEEEKVQAKQASTSAPIAPGASAVAASPGAAGAIKSMGSGKPLARADRAFFEPRFGADLSGVRVHDGPAADTASQGINARAFTLGKDVAFARGEYQPGTQSGRHLMAHELAHVVGEGGAARRQVRRLGDLAQVPGGMTCPVRQSSSPNTTIDRFSFTVGSPTLTPDSKAKISTIAAGFHSLGGNINFDIDGYASTDGPQGLNWNLSCQRAEAVRSEIETPSDGSAGVPAAKLSGFANGETSEFGRSLPANRIAKLSSDKPFAPVSCQNGTPDSRASACIQPVRIADDDGSNPTSMLSFAESQSIWGRCCVDVSVNSDITVDGTRFKDIHRGTSPTTTSPPTAEESAMITAAGVSGNCVPVFIVETINMNGVSGPSVSGGGYTLFQGLSPPHIIAVESGGGWLIAHELGHTFDVHHNFSPRADGTVTIARPTGSPTVAGAENVSDQICDTSRASSTVSTSGGSRDCCRDLT